MSSCLLFKLPIESFEAGENGVFGLSGLSGSLRDERFGVSSVLGVLFLWPEGILPSGLLGFFGGVDKKSNSSRCFTAFLIDGPELTPGRVRFVELLMVGRKSVLIENYSTNGFD